MFPTVSTHTLYFTFLIASDTLIYLHLYVDVLIRARTISTMVNFRAKVGNIGFFFYYLCTNNHRNMNMHANNHRLALRIHYDTLQRD